MDLRMPYWLLGPGWRPASSVSRVFDCRQGDFYQWAQDKIIPTNNSVTDGILAPQLTMFGTLKGGFRLDKSQ
jgi:hypothetical protein